ncbi:MAG: hypothetical protein HOY69_34485 [Streptomyces sp.]|nr:hypothetical protein [Streptomyces sp.]
MRQRTIAGRRVMAGGFTAVALAAALAGCGGQDGPPRDKGPVCAGTAPADGMHVLRGGSHPLPGGALVTYSDASADGRTRTATLTTGASGAGTRVRAGRQVSIGGHAYAVAQVCTYRVVLEPQSAADRAAAGAEPAAGHDAAAQRTRCFSTAPAARAARVAGMPPNGMTVLQGRQNIRPTGITVGGNDIGSKTATFTVTCAGDPVLADYQHVRSGDTVEIGDVLYTVGSIHSGTSITLVPQGS